MNRLPRALAVAPLASLASLAACTQSPSLRVVDVKTVERTEQATVVEFTLEGENLNDIELPLRTARYSLQIDGARVFEGERSPEATLRREGTQRFVLPAPIPASLASGGGQRPYRLAGTLGYIAPGQLAEVMFDLGVSNPTVDFSQSGTLDLGAPVTPKPAPPPPVFTRPPNFELGGVPGAPAPPSAPPRAGSRQPAAGGQRPQPSEQERRAPASPQAQPVPSPTPDPPAPPAPTP